LKTKQNTAGAAPAPHFDEPTLRGLRDHLESRFGAATPYSGNGVSVRSNLCNGRGNPAERERLVRFF